MINDYQNGICSFDAHYRQTGLVSIYVILDRGRAAIVDTANNLALPHALDALRELGVPRENVDYILLTHVHLDHAGGAGLFMREFVNAKLVLHPRGSRHVINPTKLLASAREVYGKEEVAHVYGELVPVPESRVRTPRDGEELTLGGRTIVCLDTPGHAKHHMAYLDRTANAVFTGDVFGMSFSGRGEEGRLNLTPTTSPVQFDPEAMHRSVERIAALRPSAVYLTHFGEVREVERAAADLHRKIEEHVEAVERAGGDYKGTADALGELFEAESERLGLLSPREDIRERFKNVISLNAQGLCVWYKDKKAKSGS